MSPKIELATRSTVRETRPPFHQCESDTVSFGHEAASVTKVGGEGGNGGEGGGCEVVEKAEVVKLWRRWRL